MVPFYRRFIALVVAGMASVLAYTVWFLRLEKKKEEPAQKENKGDLKEKEEKTAVAEKEGVEESRKKDSSQKDKAPEIKKEENAKGEKSVGDGVKKPEVDVKTCKSIRGAISPQKMSVRRTGSSSSDSLAKEQKSALTLLNELKENSTRCKLAAVEKTNETQSTTNPMMMGINSAAPQEPTKPASEAAVVPSIETPKDIQSASTSVPGAKQPPSGKDSKSATLPAEAPVVLEIQKISPSPLPTNTASEPPAVIIMVPTVPMAAPVKESTRKAPIEVILTPTDSQPKAPDATSKNAEATQQVLASSVLTASPTKESILPGVLPESRETAMLVEPLAKSHRPQILAKVTSAQTSPSVSTKAVNSSEGSSRLAIIPGTTLTAMSSKVDASDGEKAGSKVMGIHQCFCRPSGKSKPLEDNECVFDEKVKFKLKQTEIHPISYSYYDPIPLIKPIKKKKTSLAKEITTKPEKEKVDYLTPFNPILGAMAYAHQHSQMIEDLIFNKDLFDY